MESSSKDVRHRRLQGDGSHWTRRHVADAPLVANAPAVAVAWRGSSGVLRVLPPQPTDKATDSKDKLVTLLLRHMPHV